MCSLQYLHQSGTLVDRKTGLLKHIHMNTSGLHAKLQKE